MHRWTVKDVMTDKPVSVSTRTPFKEIVAVLAENAVSAVPVVNRNGEVVGVVSQADLLHKMEFVGLAEHVRLLESKRRWTARTKSTADLAVDLMNRPPITVGPDADLASAAKLMEKAGVKRLPVVDRHGQLVGIVSRGDLLRVYLRDDSVIRDEICRQVLLHTLWIDPATVTVAVDNGVVTLGGTVDRLSTAHIITRLVANVSGVVDVVDELTYQHDDTAELHRHHLMGATVKETTP